jgi:carboxypeptidase Taq
MSKSIDIDQAIRQNEIIKINEWLKTNIHQYGKLLEPKDLVLMATGEAFNPNYYVDYLIKKYEHILGIKA